MKCFLAAALSFFITQSLSCGYFFPPRVSPEEELIRDLKMILNETGESGAKKTGKFRVK